MNAKQRRKSDRYKKAIAKQFLEVLEGCLDDLDSGGIRYRNYESHLKR